MARTLGACALGILIAAQQGSILAAAVAVTSNRYDTNRTAANLAETVLTTANINTAHFGKVGSLPVDGPIFAQPLYVPNEVINGVPHNVLYVATMHNSVYAFDADKYTLTGTVAPLWTANLGPPGANRYGGQTDDNVLGDTSLGVLSTPAIDLPSATIYLVATTSINGVNTPMLHALNLATGRDRVPAVAILDSSISPAGVLDPVHNIQRAGLTLSEGNVYVAFSGNPDDFQPYAGWVITYSMKTLTKQASFTTSANNGGSIWQSGLAAPVDAAGNIYYLTGNGYGGTDGPGNFAETLLKFNGGSLSTPDYFVPSNYGFLDANDLDLSVAGPMLIPGSSNLIAFGSKFAEIYVANTKNLGHLQSGDPQLVQHFVAGPAFFAVPAIAVANGTQSTGSPPASAVFNAKLYIAYKANDGSQDLVVTSTPDGVNVAAATFYPGISIGSAPTMAVFNNKLYVAFQSSSSHALCVTSSSDGLNFASPVTSYAGISVGSAPAMAVFNNKLYIAFRANDASNTLWLASSADGVNFTTVNYPSIAIGNSPGIAVFKNKLYIAFQANDASHTLWVASSPDGVSFTTVNYPGIALGSAPAMTVLNNVMYVAFQANDPSDELYVTSSVDGINLISPANAYPGISIAGTPSLTTFNSQLYSAFQANDSTHLLYLASTTSTGAVGIFNDGDRVIGLAYWYRTHAAPLMYAWPGYGNLLSVPFTGSAFDLTKAAYGSVFYGGGEPSVSLSLSANGDLTGTGVVWAMLTTGGNGAGAPGILYAFDAISLQELWDSTQVSTDSIGALAKFVVPVVSNGKVYVATSGGTVYVFASH